MLSHTRTYFSHEKEVKVFAFKTSKMCSWMEKRKIIQLFEQVSSSISEFGKKECLQQKAA